MGSLENAGGVSAWTFALLDGLWLEKLVSFLSHSDSIKTEKAMPCEL